MHTRTTPAMTLRLTGLTLFLAISACQAPATDDAPASVPSNTEERVARAASLELDTEYVGPPGDALTHHTSGFAKILCSAVFITGLEADFAAENIGYFSSHYAERAEVTERVVDTEKKEVHLTLPDGTVRTARYLGDQGCVTLPIGADDVYFTPIDIPSTLPDPSTQPWPMGDVLPDEPLPSELDAAKIEQAVDAAFEPAEGMTAAFVVTHRGRIIGERYRDGITMSTPLESWSMGKSLTATLMGILIRQGVYELHQPAPIPEWQDGNDPRAEIRISDILRMSSGLRFRNEADPGYDESLGYPDHLYVYTGTVNSFEYAATRPQQYPPNTVGRYRNSDPVLTNYLIRLGVEGRGDEYHSFPQRELFDKIGIRHMVMETDPYGDFLLQEGFVEFVSTPAPGWVADGRPIYGGFFWIESENGSNGIPAEAYSMQGAGGQSTTIIPSHDLVVVRLGHYKGGRPGAEGLRNAFALLMEAVPDNR